MNKIFTVMVFCALLCASCTAQISGSLKVDGQADLNIYAALEPRMTALIGGLAAASGAVQPGAPILNSSAIAASMSSAPGIASVALKNIAPAAIEGPIKVSRISDFLASGKTGNKAQGSRSFTFITFEQSKSSTGGKCTVNFNRNSGPEALGLISPEIGDYLAALMAPLATGEVLTKAEYLTLVGSVYGKGIADEISQAFVRAFIDFPGQVQSAKGGTFSGRRAEFAIPLLDILTLEKPLSYEVVWK
ncbi:MAG: hypothetical protein LBH20_07240 [Treponema sp.]|jgi:hypothetical protein|nr:hypothetical protein [Treponema sp.]